MERLGEIESSYGGIDYFCLNEVTPALAKYLKKRDYKIHYSARNALEGIAIITKKHRLSKPEVHYLSVRDYLKYTASLISVEAISPKDGKKIQILTTHLTYNRISNFQARRSEFNELLKHLPSEGAVFGGDLNTYPLKRYKLHRIKKLGYKKLSRGITMRKGINLRFNYWWMSLDHVFATPDIADNMDFLLLKKYYPSDHRPLLITVK